MLQQFLEGLGPSLYIYLAAVVLGGAALWLGFMRSLRRVRQARRDNVMSRRVFDAVPTASPIDNPAMAARERGLKSIDEQFSIVRRVFAPLLAVLVLLLLVIPFLEDVPASALSLMVGALTVIIGIAARPIVENAISGLALAISKTINIGDTVLIDDHYGTVEDITFTHTVIKIWDWRRYVVPNASLSQLRIINYSLNDKQIWACVEFWISYETDLELAKKLANEAATSSAHYSPGEAPSFWLMDMHREGIQCWIAAWADTPSDAWSLKNDVRTELAIAFRKHGIRTHAYQQRIDGAGPRVAFLTDDDRDPTRRAGSPEAAGG